MKLIQRAPTVPVYPLKSTLNVIIHLDFFACWEIWVRNNPSKPYCDAVIFGCVDGALSFPPITYSGYCNLCADDE